ncbi:cytochrome P450 2J2-like [Acanthaster planci]|uniref:Cytochrome P450 2J2-like n=1 Tax=Acanthaster planci TaxID=133434 RepID=A0A8B7ZCG4_ACAPL|nr:cytochrome P450 2J2-like [Acanthaster planci]
MKIYTSNKMDSVDHLIFVIFDSCSLGSGFLYAITFFSVLWLFLRWRTAKPNFARGPSFLMSHLLLLKAALTRRSAPQLLFTDIAKTYGPIYSLWIGFNFVTVVTDLELSREALIRNPDSFAHRRNAAVLERIFQKGGGIISESGNPWKERRRFGMNAMRIFGAGKRRLEPRINEEANFLAQSFADHCGQPFDPIPLVINAVSNIVAQISLGQRFEYTDTSFQAVVRIMRDLTEVGILEVGNVFPALADTFLYQRKRSDFRQLKGFIEEQVRIHRATLKANDPRDLIDLYLQEADKESTDFSEKDLDSEPVFTESNVWRFIQDIFFAGTETTALSLLWILHLVTMHPEIQEKVQVEIDDVIGRARQPTTSDMVSMPYTQATILEVIRHRPVIPVYHRESPPDGNGKFAQYTVPRNSYFLINVYGMNHDPKVFPDPDMIRPERFLTVDKNGKRIFSGKGQLLMNFGSGKRACVGESMARTELFLFVVNLFQRFTFTFSAEDGPPNLEGVPGRIWSPLPFRLCAETRL